MAELRTIIIVTVSMALIYSVVDAHNGRGSFRHSGNFQHQKPCTDDPHMNPFHPPCQTSPVIPTEPLASPTTTGVQENVVNVNENTVESTSLERAHWCRFNNGSYLPLNHTYIRGTCLLCQCTLSHAIRCKPFECMPTYCVDNKMPSRKSGQCCTQCDYEVVRNTCQHNGISYPHGAMIEVPDEKIQCWCQLGDIECRDYMGSLFQRWSMWGDGTVIYIIAIVLFTLLSFGLLVCCGCTFLIYHYYQRHEHTFEEAYAQYIGEAGWQPIYEEEEQYEVDTSAQEKHLEAEKSQDVYRTNDFLPPPYDMHNNPYVSTYEQKHI